MLYLGHVISGGKVRLDPEIVKSVQDYPEPKTKSMFALFLARRVLSMFCSWVWDSGSPPHSVDKEGSTCIQLKGVLISQPVLQVADSGKPFILQTDVSEYGLGTVLSQEDGKVNSAQ